MADPAKVPFGSDSFVPMRVAVRPCNSKISFPPAAGGMASDTSAMPDGPLAAKATRARRGTQRGEVVAQGQERI